MKNTSSTCSGFILVELIVSIVLLGIIGVFTSMFLYTGINGYLISKRTADGALRAQIALDRINLELRKVNNLPVAPVADAAITYTTDDLPGTRRILYDSNENTISIDNGTTTNVLLNEVETFNLSWDVADLDNSGGGVNEIAGITIGFRLTGIGRPFNMRIYPRNWLSAP